MSKLNLINTILDDFFKEEKISKLQERKVNMAVDFIGDNVKYLSFSFDKDLPKSEFPKGLFPFFNRGEAKVCSFCDYLIFSEIKGQIFVLLIELKMGKSDVTKQLAAGKCFAEYVISTVNRVFNQKINPEIRQISIREIYRKPKQKQREIKYVDNFYTFSDSKFWLKKYLV